METFELQIELGNDAMQDPRDVAAALRQTADRIYDTAEPGSWFNIRDDNGNTVGSYGFDLAKHEVREETDAENAFKVASFNAAKSVVDGHPVAAREWLEVAKHASQLGGLEGVRRLKIEPGDTIVLQSSRRMSVGEHNEIVRQIKSEIGDVRVLLFDATLSPVGVWQPSK